MAGVTGASGISGLRSLLAAAAGLVVLNALFTVANLEPTAWVRLTPRVSVEVLLGLVLLALAGGAGLEWTWPRRLLLAGLVTAAALLRYVHITVPGVMGRPLDAHADLPHLRSVLGMFTESLPLPGLLLTAAGVLLVLAGCLAVVLAALVALEPVVGRPRLRRVAGLVAVALVPALGLGALDGRRLPLVAEPVTVIAAGHLSRLWSGGGEMDELRRRLDDDGGTIPPPAGLDGAHVVVIFLESYGVTLIEDAQHYPYIAPRFAGFEQRLRDAGLAVRSAKMVSPAFGGGSWRAHATLLSGVPIDGQHAYDLLLSSHRRTLVHLLADAGYRTVAAVPGIRGEWPAAAFFAFDAVYDAPRLEYRGKSIGWWVIPDQHTLFEVSRRELYPGAPPLFAHIVLISTHIPYLPVPPYVRDWSRFADGTAYERAIPSVAADDYRDLTELSSRYVRAFLYELQILEDFLVERTPENTLVIVAGDHQPPKLATHTNDSWAVPVHLFSRRAELVEPFSRFGFEPRVVPRGGTRLGMEDFFPLFLRAFAAEEGGAGGGGR